MKKKILLIEDEAALREATAAFLESEGFHVVAAEDGRKGLETALKGTADLIVMDLMLPSMSGLEICRALREKGVSSPIIMVTGHVGRAAKVAGLSAGVEAYMTKPIDPVVLARTLAEACGPTRDAVDEAAAA